jgi:hypothetical protein
MNDSETYPLAAAGDEAQERAEPSRAAPPCRVCVRWFVRGDLRHRWNAGRR